MTKLVRNGGGGIRLLSLCIAFSRKNVGHARKRLAVTRAESSTCYNSCHHPRPTYPGEPRPYAPAIYGFDRKFFTKFNRRLILAITPPGSARSSPGTRSPRQCGPSRKKARARPAQSNRILALEGSFPLKSGSLRSVLVRTASKSAQSSSFLGGFGAAEEVRTGPAYLDHGLRRR